MTLYGNYIMLSGSSQIVSYAYICVHFPSGETITCTGDGQVMSYTGDGTCVFPIRNNGTYTLSCDDMTETVVISYSGQIEHRYMCFPTFGDNDWDTIAEISKLGLASQYWNVGDTKTITLNGTTKTLAIMDFNKYEVIGNSSYPLSKCGIVLGLVEGYTTHQMINNYPANWGGSTCTMRTDLDLVYKLYLDNDIRKNIQQIKIPYYYGTELTTVSEYLFIPSYTEVFGYDKTTTNIPVSEGTQLVYYQTLENRQKTDGSSAISWWTRTPYINDYLKFYNVKTDGTASTTDGMSSDSNYVSFCFGI